MEISVFIIFVLVIPMICGTLTNYNLHRKDVNACVDQPVCAQLSDVCSSPDQALAQTLCPVKCGLCPTPGPLAGCVDSPGINCTAVATEVCVFESAFLLCPRTCNLCGQNPSSHPCRDLVVGLRCENLPNPCNDTVGRISCPLFCGLCAAASFTTTAMVDPTSGPCDVAPCVNGGSCVPNGFMFTCSCRHGYSGPLCSIGPPPLTVVATQQTAATPTVATELPTTAMGPCVLIDKDHLGCNAAEVIFMVEYAEADGNYDGCGIMHEGHFIKKLVNRWDLEHTGIRVGVVSYHDTVEDRIHVDDYGHNKTALKNGITALTGNCRDDPNGAILQPSGNANLTKALDFVRETSLKGSRPGVPRVVIPIIHNMPSGSSERQAMVDASQRLKDTCTSVLPLINLYQPKNHPNTGIHIPTGHRIASSPYTDYYSQYYDYEDVDFDSVSHYGKVCH